MPSALTARQLAILVGLGFTLWAIAAVLLRILSPMGALAGNAAFLTYALIVPGTLPFIYLTRALAGLTPGQLFAGVAVLTTVALLIDGIVVAFLPAIYADSPATLAPIAAAILWGAGVGLALAFVVERRG